MKYAVVSIKGKQYKIEENTEFLVHKLNEGEKLVSETLLVVNEDKVKIGTPILKTAKIELKVIGNEKGKKIHVYKFKSKSRYRRKIGSRPEFTRIAVGKIAFN